MRRRKCSACGIFVGEGYEESELFWFMRHKICRHCLQRGLSVRWESWEEFIKGKRKTEMEYRYDVKDDIAYILINKLPFAYSRELDETRFIDYARDGTVIGVELLYVSGGVDVSGLPYKSEIAKLLEEHDIKVLA